MADHELPEGTPAVEGMVSGRDAPSGSASSQPETGQPRLLGRLKNLAARKKPRLAQAASPSAPAALAGEAPGEAPGQGQEDVAEARQHFEEQRMTRRAALRRLGVTAGIGAVYMLSVDDLARACISRLHEQEFTREVADTLAAELGHSGMAVAATASSTYGYGTV